MTPHEFIATWKPVDLSERSACQQHFLDLCELLGQPKPAAADPEGAWYTFEKGVHKTQGGQGWADVWMKNHFGWEYKGKHRDLKAAYAQLQQYREALENPPRFFGVLHSRLHETWARAQGTQVNSQARSMGRGPAMSTTPTGAASGRFAIRGSCRKTKSAPRN
jgi:hypothetical protein